MLFMCKSCGAASDTQQNVEVAIPRGHANMRNTWLMWASKCSSVWHTYICWTCRVKHSHAFSTIILQFGFQVWKGCWRIFALGPHHFLDSTLGLCWLKCSRDFDIFSSALCPLLAKSRVFCLQESTGKLWGLSNGLSENVWKYGIQKSSKIHWLIISFFIQIVIWEHTTFSEWHTQRLFLYLR